jgi:hypothetical protein
VGIPIGNQPFNFPFFGAGVNLALKKFHFAPFAGVLYKKEQRSTLPPGSNADQATLDQSKYTTRVWKLMYGLSFSVSDAVKLFKK